MSDKNLANNSTKIKCPKCGGPITLKTISHSGKVGEPKEEKWLWGSDDERARWEMSHTRSYRAIMCRLGKWVHFRVGNDTGRLVYLSN